MRITERNGVYFIEGSHPAFKPISPISTELNNAFSQDQLKSLDDVKDKMAREAKLSGGNCVSEFRYGQRSGGFWAQMWSVDNCLWYGSGTIGVLPPDAAARS